MRIRLILTALAGLMAAGTTQIASAQTAPASPRVTPVYYGGYYGYRPAPPPYYHHHYWRHSWHHSPRYGYYRQGYPYRY